MKLIVKGDYSGDVFYLSLIEFRTMVDLNDEDELEGYQRVKALTVGESTNCGLFTVTRLE